MKFSVITVNRNNTHGLDKTMQSVFAQTWQDFEYIVVDGASVDTSVDVLNRFNNTPHAFPFSWISEPDSGIYSAMNKGIRIATGEYLLFLNSGDRLVASDTLQTLSQQTLQADIVYGYQYDDVNGELVTEPCIDVAYITFDTLRKAHIPHQSTLIKREALLHVGGYDESYRIISDWAFVMRGLFRYNMTIQRINTYIAVYDTTGISSNTDKTVQWTERSLFLHRDFPLFMPDYERWDKLNNTFYVRLIRMFRAFKSRVLCSRKK